MFLDILMYEVIVGLSFILFDTLTGMFFWGLYLRELVFFLDSDRCEVFSLLFMLDCLFYYMALL